MGRELKLFFIIKVYTIFRLHCVAVNVTWNGFRFWVKFHKNTEGIFDQVGNYEMNNDYLTVVKESGQDYRQSEMNQCLVVNYKGFCCTFLWAC